MGRRGGMRSSKMTHSIKKLLRRQGAPGLVKSKKAKARPPVHPGHKVLSVNAKRKLAAAAGEDDETMGLAQKSGTVARAEARKVAGKQARLDEIARRRGILPSSTAPEPPAEVEESPEEAANAANAAKRALAFAPTNQRAFHKELSTVLKSSDVLLEVLDARDPMGCRCLPLEEAVLAKCKGKRLVLILNKVDLVPPEIAQRWLTYLRQYFPTLPFKAATQSGQRDIGRSKSSAGKLHSYGSEAYGGDGLLQLLKNYSRSMGMKTAVTVGIVGYPNVGKSSLINSLKRARAVNVGATPGVTTTAQVVSLDSKVKLMDCPGIVFARAHTAEEQADVVLRNSVRVEKLEDPTVPVEAILRRVSAEQLMRQYDVARFADATEFLTLVAAKRGHLRKGGAADHDAAARAVLQDWNAGAIKYYTEPPNPTGGVEMVSELAEGFDWNAAVPRVETADETAAAAAAQAASSAAATSAPSSRAPRGDPRGGRAASSGAAASGAASGAEPDEMAISDEPRATLLAGWTQAHDRGADAKKKKPRPPTKRAAAIDVHTLDDERFNFQTNRGIRKTQMLKAKKARRRAAATSLLL